MGQTNYWNDPVYQPDVGIWEGTLAWGINPTKKNVIVKLMLVMHHGNRNR